MKKIIIYADEDCGLAVQQEDHYITCKDKTDVLMEVDKIFNEHEQTSCKPKNRPNS